jgi:hypothetical protein
VEKAGTNGKELIFADEIRITAFGIYMLEHLSRTFTPDFPFKLHTTMLLTYTEAA